MFGGSGVMGEERRVELFWLLRLLIDCFFGESRRFWRVCAGCWCSDLHVGGVVEEPGERPWQAALLASV